MMSSEFETNKTESTCPAFSFIIPNYNYGRYLKRCIDSCLDQPVEAEVFVVDGASTDNTLSVLKSYGDRIRWISEPDQGQSDALNKGVQLASGDYIAWINSDDYYPNSQPFRKIAELIRSQPETDIVYGHVEFVDQAERTYRLRRSRPGLQICDFLVNPYETIVQPELIFRRQLFLDVGGVNLDYHYSMDLDLWLRMFQTAPHTTFLDEIIACARIHKQAKTRQFIRNSIAETRQLMKQYRQQIPLSWRERFQAAYYQAKVEAYWLAVNIGLHKVPT